VTESQRRRLIAFAVRSVVSLETGAFLMKSSEALGKSWLLQPDPDTGDLWCSCENFDLVGVCIHTAVLVAAIKAMIDE
jgi:hypothetical protein